MFNFMLCLLYHSKKKSKELITEKIFIEINWIPS